MVPCDESRRHAKSLGGGLRQSPSVWASLGVVLGEVYAVRATYGGSDRGHFRGNNLEQQLLALIFGRILTLLKHQLQCISACAVA